MIVETRDSGQVEEILLEENNFPACINPTRPAVSASTQRKHSPPTQARPGQPRSHAATGERRAAEKKQKKKK
jgi:hypothetical protein